MPDVHSGVSRSALPATGDAAVSAGVDGRRRPI